MSVVNNLEKITLPQGREVYFAERVGSTNDIAAQLGREGAPPFTAVWGNEQSKGRGRLGRRWQTYPDVGLAVSVLLPETYGQILPVVVSVALHKALSGFARPEAAQKLKIKWPNDLLIDGRKLAGILTESYSNPTGGRFYVVGMGLNIRHPNSQGQGEIDTATLEEICIIPPERTFVLEAVLQSLQKTLDVFPENRDDAHLIHYYKKNCSTFGQQVTWRDSGLEVQGTAEDITPKGHLILRTESGNITCNVGEIITHHERF